MKKYIGLFLILFLVSCKAKVVAIAETKVASDNIMTAEKIIENHYNNKNDFSTLYIKANAKYQDVNQSQNVTAEIKIKKDDRILISVRVLGLFEGAMANHGNLFFFTPLIAAMAGNVGVQSSAIIVQGLANQSISGSLWNRLIKEVSLSLLNGIILASILFVGSHFLLNVEIIIGEIVTIALISVIIIASLIGTFIPIILDKYGVDPALATGPFITTSNDIMGILIYFSIAKAILGF
jgi:cation transporter-like permease